MPSEASLSTDTLLLELEQYVAGYSTHTPVIDDDLLVLLGCPFHQRRSGVLGKAAARDPDRHVFISRLLIAMAPIAGAATSTTCLVGGVARNKCLPFCTRTEDGAYALAAVIVSYLEVYSPNDSLHSMSAPAVGQVLNDWLKPESRWHRLPSVRTVCERLFGAIWCTVALPDSADANPEDIAVERRCVADLILRDRPAFMSAFSQSTAVIGGIALPSGLGAPS